MTKGNLSFHTQIANSKTMYYIADHVLLPLMFQHQFQHQPCSNTNVHHQSQVLSTIVPKFPLIPKSTPLEGMK